MTSIPDWLLNITYRSQPSIVPVASELQGNRWPGRRRQGASYGPDPFLPVAPPAPTEYAFGGGVISVSDTRTMTPEAKGAPLDSLILPHGGPTARDYLRFDWLVQFVATRRYAVLQPQFRGSTGFGDAFREAGDRQWGGLTTLTGEEHWLSRTESRTQVLKELDTFLQQNLSPAPQ
jgi:dipeptidyl aminopeptidase/acylaminoacyl peptidase